MLLLWQAFESWRFKGLGSYALHHLLVLNHTQYSNSNNVLQIFFVEPLQFSPSGYFSSSPRYACWRVQWGMHITQSTGLFSATILLIARHWGREFLVQGQLSHSSLLYFLSYTISATPKPEAASSHTAEKLAWVWEPTNK